MSDNSHVNIPKLLSKFQNVKKSETFIFLNEIGIFVPENFSNCTKSFSDRIFFWHFYPVWSELLFAENFHLGPYEVVTWLYVTVKLLIDS